MQIVIDIPEHIYSRRYTLGFYGQAITDKIVFDAVKNGTPLPKGHGRLIDENEVIKSLFDYNKGKKTIGQCINDTSTVLGAEKESTDADSN